MTSTRWHRHDWINTLQHTATHYNTLQHTASHCNTLKYSATHCNTRLRRDEVDINSMTWTLSFSIDLTDRWCSYFDFFSFSTADYFSDNDTKIDDIDSMICWLFRHGRCNTLQHTAEHCKTLQHTAIHCNALQNTAKHDIDPMTSGIFRHGRCNTLQHTATHCNTLQHTTLTRWQVDYSDMDIDSKSSTICISIDSMTSISFFFQRCQMSFQKKNEMAVDHMEYFWNDIDYFAILFCWCSVDTGVCAQV